jgi:hypothetical protein
MNLTRNSEFQKLVFTNLNTNNYFTFEGKEYKAVSEWPMQLGHREKILHAIDEERFWCVSHGSGHDQRGDAFMRHYDNFKYDF